MTLVILGISILLMVIGYVLFYYTAYEEVGAPIIVVSIMSLIVSIIATVYFGVNVKSNDVIDDKIAMYQEENTKIEEQIAIVVSDYMEHESKVFDSAKASSPVILVQLYPELKSDELIKSQIDIYIANNEKIKDLKLKKINDSVYRWWLYFGK